MKLKAEKKRRDATGQTDLQFARRALVSEAVKQSRANMTRTYRRLHPPIAGVTLTAAETEMALHHRGVCHNHFYVTFVVLAQYLILK